MDLAQRQAVNRMISGAQLLQSLDVPDTQRRMVTDTGSLGLSTRERGQYDICRLITDLANGTKHSAELDLSRELESRGQQVHTQNSALIPNDILYRDLTVANAGAGGYLVATETGEPVDIARPAPLLDRLGVQRVNDLVGSLVLPRLSGAATITWLTNEGAPATEQTESVAQVALTPKTASAYVEMSRLLLLQSNPRAQRIVTDDLTKVANTAEETAALNGSGISGTPLGILATTGVGSVSGSSIALAGLANLQTALGDNLDGGCAFVTTRAVASLLAQRQRFTGATEALWQGALRGGLLAGVPAFSTSLMPTAVLLCGNFTRLIVARWGAVEIAVNPFAQHQKAIVGVRVMLSMDVGVLDVGAFAAASSIT